MTTPASDNATAPAPRARPLSPHLQVYRPQITSIMSILHRITGVGLALGAVVLVLWLASAAAGPAAYDSMQNFLGSWFGILLLMGWSWALFYHLCNGIRHLLWDAGIGFSLEAVENSGIIAIGVTTLATLLVWVFGFFLMG
jgi:succinate dehydrogenase / fumarate reductase cytochrome b subunit